MGLLSGREQDGSRAVGIGGFVSVTPSFVDKKLAGKAVLLIVDLVKITISRFEVTARSIEQGQVMRIGKGMPRLSWPVLSEHGRKFLARGKVKNCFHTRKLPSI